MPRAIRPALWLIVRSFYVEGYADEEGKRQFPTIQETAKHFDMKVPTILIRAAKERWNQEREVFIANVQELAQKTKIQQLASQLVEFDTKCFKIADTLATFANNKLAEYVKQNQIPPLDVQNQIANTLKTAQYIGRLALGESTENPRYELPKASFRIVGSRPLIEGESSPADD